MNDKYKFWKRKNFGRNTTYPTMLGIFSYLIVNKILSGSWKNVNWFAIETYFEWKAQDFAIYGLLGIVIMMWIFVKYYPEEKISDSTYNEILRGMKGLD